MLLAAARTRCTAGSSRPMSTATIARTTSSSTRVKADGRRTGDRGRTGLSPFCRAGQRGAPTTAAADVRTDGLRLTRRLLVAEARHWFARQAGLLAYGS